MVQIVKMPQHFPYPPSEVRLIWTSGNSEATFTTLLTKMTLTPWRDVWFPFKEIHDLCLTKEIHVSCVPSQGSYPWPSGHLTSPVSKRKGVQSHPVHIQSSEKGYSHIQSFTGSKWDSIPDPFHPTQNLQGTSTTSCSFLNPWDSHYVPPLKHPHFTLWNLVSISAIVHFWAFVVHLDFQFWSLPGFLECGNSSFLSFEGCWCKINSFLFRYHQVKVAIDREHGSRTLILRSHPRWDASPF